MGEKIYEAVTSLKGTRVYVRESGDYTNRFVAGNQTGRMEIGRASCRERV